MMPACNAMVAYIVQHRITRIFNATINAINTINTIYNTILFANLYEVLERGNTIPAGSHRATYYKSYE